MEEPAFDFKLGGCFIILVEGTIIIEANYSFNLGILALATGCLKRIFGNIFGNIIRNIFGHCTYRTAPCKYKHNYTVRISILIYRKADINFSILFTVSSELIYAFVSFKLYKYSTGSIISRYSVENQFCCYKQSNWTEP